ncbi:MAG: hypothetical protein AAB420_02190 [Patescibacteria group bacterium]
MIVAGLLLMLASYIFISNRLVSQRYILSLQQQELHSVGTDVATQEEQITRGQDMENLLALVSQQGMIANHDGQTLFITSKVARLP